LRTGPIKTEHGRFPDFKNVGADRSGNEQRRERTQMGFMADNREIASKRFQTWSDGRRFCLGFKVGNLGNFCGGGDGAGE
jgi:hypothetical protein